MNAWEKNIDDAERYTLSSPLEIVNILRALTEQHALLSLHHGERFIVTSLLAIKPEREEIIFDYGADEVMNRGLQQADKLIAVGYLDHIKVQFTTGKLETVQFEGRPAFKLPLPKSLLRIQRRENYRVKVPLSKPIYCAIPLTEGSRTHKFRVHNISVSGICLIGYTKDLVPGTRYKNCQLELPDIGTVTADLEIANETITTEPNGEKRCGCAFVDMPGRMATLIQRYIIKIDRERMA